jgi:hypothetical protein
MPIRIAVEKATCLYNAHWETSLTWRARVLSESGKIVQKSSALEVTAKEPELNLAGPLQLSQMLSLCIPNSSAESQILKTDPFDLAEEFPSLPIPSLLLPEQLIHIHIPPGQIPLTNSHIDPLTQ